MPNLIENLEHAACGQGPDAEQTLYWKARERIKAQDALLARAADCLNARPYNNDMVLGAEISDFRAKSQQ